MKKTLTFLMPFAIFADSFDEYEKDLFGESLSKNEQTSSESQNLIADQAPAQQSTRSTDKKSARLQAAPSSSGSGPRVLRYTFGGDVLYLKPYFSNVPYLITSDLTNYSNPSPHNSSSKLVNQKMSGDLGFTVWASYMSNWADLTTEARWSRYHTSSHQKSYSISDFGNNGYNAPLAINYVWNSSYTEPYQTNLADNPYQSFTAYAKGTTSLNLDWIDLTFKFPYKTKKHLAVLPYVGVRGFLFEYKSTITRYKNYWGTAPSTNPQNQNVDKLKERFNAVGPNLGVDASLIFGHGFSFDLMAQGSFVFGQLDSYNNSSKTQLNDNVFAGYSQKTNLFKGLFDLRMGFSYEKDWNKVGFMAEVGYDLHYMPNLIQLMNPAINQVFRSDLSTQGVYGGLALKF